MLEYLFSSTARIKILKFFCINSRDKFFIRQLTRRLGLQINSLRRELNNLEKFGLLNIEEKEGKKYYFVNHDFSLFSEIYSLVFKAIALEEMQIAEKMSKISGLKLLIFTGVLTNSPANTDVLIVGKVNRKEFDRYLNSIAEGLVDELRYTFLSKVDYLYRLDITDKFIYDIWSNENIVVVDKISAEVKKKQLNDFNLKHFRS